METLTLADFDAASAEFDAAVVATPGIDHFCSSSAWVLPAARALMPPRDPWLFRCEAGFAACMHHDAFGAVEPLELAWGLACPLVGGDPDALCAAFAGECLFRRGAWRYLALSGVPMDGALCRAVVRHFGQSFPVRVGSPTVRHVASLEGGVDGFLSRRSRNLRKGLRQTQRAAAAAGITFESVRVTDGAAAAALYERILAVERRSWKSQEGHGIASGPMCEFYRRMIRRLAVEGRQRTIFGRHRDQDVSYILGGVLGDRYRGLQFSFDADYEAYGLGGLGQYHQIVELAAEGVSRYDLGTDMDYKRRWAESADETVMLVVDNRAGFGG
jgi:hypothetical protein